MYARSRDGAPAAAAGGVQPVPAHCGCVASDSQPLPADSATVPGTQSELLPRSVQLAAGALW